MVKLSLLNKTVRYLVIEVLKPHCELFSTALERCHAYARYHVQQESENEMKKTKSKCTSEKEWQSKAYTYKEYTYIDHRNALQKMTLAINAQMVFIFIFLHVGTQTQSNRHFIFVLFKPRGKI